MSAHAALGSCLLILAVFAGFGVVRWLAPAEQPAEPSPHVELRAIPVRREPSTASVRIKAPFAVDETLVPLEDRFLLPDGSWALALNGAKNVRVSWPREVPYAPIVARIVGADGYERYRHADGSETVTYPMFRPDLGRMDSVATVLNPTTAVPIESDRPASADPKVDSGLKR